MKALRIVSVLMLMIAPYRPSAWGDDPPLSAGDMHQLDHAYVVRAKADVILQLSRAGVRLAHLLNQALK